MRRRIVYSTDFKKSKVKDILSKKKSISEVATMYELSYTAVYRWVQKYGNIEPEERIVIEKDSDYLKHSKQVKRIKDLEQMLGRLALEADYYKRLVKEANDHFGQDIEKLFEKKF